MIPLTVIRAAVVLTIVLAIELVCRMGLVKPGFLVPPTLMATELWRLMGTEDFWVQVGISARSIVTAFVLAVLVGCTLAVALYRAQRLRMALEPLISSYYALPIFALYPVFIVLMGMNQGPIIVIGFLLAVMAVIVGTLNGLDRIPGVLTRVGRVHHLSPLQQALHISLPAAAPHVFTGAKLALGYAITGVLGSEFILANSGFGYALAFAYNNFEDGKMYALLLFLVVVVSLLTWALFRLERRVQHRASSAKSRVETVEVSASSKLASSLAVLAAVAALWQFVHWLVGDVSLTGPVQTVAHLAALLGTEMFWGHIAETMRALSLALLISCVAGALVGLVLGLSPRASEVTSPMLVTLYALPKVTLYPVILLFVGIGMAAKVTFGVLHGMIPMILIAMNAIRSLSPGLLLTARAMRLSRVQTIGTIVVPATIPELVTGLRISFSITLLGVMVGEMFASSRGLGFLIMNGINVNDTATMMAVTILIAAFAVTVNTALLALERRVHRT